MSEKNQMGKFIWKIIYAHTIAYFIAGIFAVFFMSYKELFATEALALFMHPVDAPIVALGPALQVFRGIIIALAIYPIRKVFFEEKRGYLKLGLIVLVFSFLSTIGPAPGSFEGFIYTTIPAVHQLIGYIESLLYIALFIGILFLADKYSNKKFMRILPVILVVLIVLMGIMGYMVA